MPFTAKAMGLVVALAFAGGTAACSDDSTDLGATIGSSPPTSVAGIPQGPTETGPDSMPNDSTTVSGSVSSESAAVFNFATDSLCDRISGKRVAEIVDTAFRSHDATPIPSGFAEEGSSDDSAYRYCGWSFNGGSVVLVETEPAEEARTQWTFAPHPALSPGVMVSEELLGWIGESGEFIDGLEVRLLVEGQDSTLEFHHTAPLGYTGDESALLAVADGLLGEMNWVPTGAIEVFSFSEHDLCKWVSAAEVAEFVAAEFDWEGMAAEVGAVYDPTVACQWELSSADGTSGSVRVHDGGLSEGFDGNRFDYDAVMKARGVLDYQGPVCIGEFVVDHPALSDGVVVFNGGFGQFAFGVPPDTEWLLLDLDVPGRTSDDWTSCEGTTGGVASEDYGVRFFAVVDQFLEELGWLSEQ